MKFLFQLKRIITHLQKPPSLLFHNLLTTNRKMNQIERYLDTQKEKSEGQQCSLPRAKTDGRLPLLPGFERYQFAVIAFTNPPTVEAIQKYVGDDYKRLDAYKKVKPADVHCAMAVMGVFEEHEKADEWATYLNDHYRNVNFCLVPFATFRFFPSYIDPRLQETTKYANPQMQEFLEKHRKRQDQLQRTHNSKMEKIQRKSDDVKETYDREVEKKRIEKLVENKMKEINYETTVNEMEETAREKGDEETLAKVQSLKLEDKDRNPKSLDELQDERKKLNVQAIRERRKLQENIRKGFKALKQG
jgi:hypothetical protein